MGNKVICRAVNKITDTKGITVGYLLQDESGSLKSVPSDNIKAALRSKAVYISNLSLSVDGRLLKSEDITPENISKLLKRINRNTGVSHSKAAVNDMMMYFSLIDTPYYIKSRLDGSNIFVGDGKSEHSLENSEQLNKLILAINSIRKQIKNNEVATDSKKSNDLVIKTSQLNSESIRKKLSTMPGFEKSDEHSVRITLREPDTNIFINFDEEIEQYNINIYNSKVNNIVITSSIGTRIDSYRHTVEIEDSIINNLDTHMRVRLRKNIILGSIISYSKLQLSNCNFINELTLHCESGIESFELSNELNVIGTLNINNLRGLAVSTYGDILVDTINIDTSVVFTLTLCCDTHSNINIKAPNCSLRVYVPSNNPVSRLITLIDEYNKDGMLIGLEDFGKEDELNKIREYVTSNFNRKTYINMMCEYRLGNFYFNCNHNLKPNNDILSTKVTNNGKRSYDVLGQIVNGEILAAYSGDNLIVEGGISLTENTHLVLNNLLIPSYNKDRKTKKGHYRLHHAGLFVREDTKEFDLTITNSIKPTAANNKWDADLVVEQLVEASKISPIKVYWGTQAYDVLASKGANLKVLNESDIPESAKSAANVEMLIGTNIFDTIKESISNSLKNDDSTQIFKTDTYSNIDIPFEIIKKFNLNLVSDESSTMTYADNSILSLLKLLPLSNLPFTPDVFNRISSDSRYRIHSKAIYRKGSIVVTSIEIVYTGITGIDTYILVTNGHKLMYMTYIGDSILKCNKGGTVGTELATQSLRKLQSVDFKSKVIKQSVTTSTPDDITSIISSIKTFINDYIAFICGYKTQILITNCANEIVAFKVSTSKEDRTHFDSNYRHSYIDEITKIEKIDSFEPLIDEIANQLNNSVIIRELQSGNNSNNDEINVVKVSTLWQLAYKDIDKNVSQDTLEDMLSLGYFNEVTETEFNKLKQKSQGSFIPIRISDGTYNVQQIRFIGTSKRHMNNLMPDIKFLIAIDYFDGTLRYFTSSISLNDLVSICNRIKASSSKDSFEQYIKVFFRMLNTGESMHYITDEKRALNDILYEFNVDNCYYTVDRDCDNAKLTLEDILNDIHNNADIANKYGIDEGTAYLLHNEALMYMYAAKLRDFNLALENLYWLEFKLDRHSRQRFQIAIKMCRVTGYCYLVVSDGQINIPYVRIASFKDALLLIRQMHDDIKAKDRGHDSILNNICWDSGSDNVYYTLYHQCDNFSKSNLYSDRFRHLVSYVPDNPIYEDFETAEQVNTAVSNGEETLLKNYDKSYIMQYIQMGALKIIDKVPSGYNYNKTFKVKDQLYKIKEYTRQSDNTYVYTIGTDMVLQTEYNLEDLLDI